MNLTATIPARCLHTIRVQILVTRELAAGRAVVVERVTKAGPRPGADLARWCEQHEADRRIPHLTSRHLSPSGASR